MSEAPRVITSLPGSGSREILERGAKVLYPGLSRLLSPLVLQRKEGYTIEDVDGNTFIDMISASASVPLGAARPDITEAAVEGIRRYGNEDAHELVSEFVVPLAEKLLEVGPPNLTRVDIALDGTEAVEAAIRFMRRATGRSLVIGFMGQYHGETAFTAALGAETAELSRGVRPVVPGMVHVPYPNPYRTPFTPRPGGTGDGTVDYIRDQLLFHVVHPSEVAGVIVEPVLGSGGCVTPGDEFWSALLDLCREYDWLLCADEVKTGFGRSGYLFACERWGIEPDLMALGKAMGGGAMPIGAVLGTERSLGFDDVESGSTWSWLPGACAAALETLRVFEREPVLENVRALEQAARSGLDPLYERHQCLGDVRVVGCFIALEFVKDRTTKERDPDLQDRVASECLKRGLLGDSASASFNLQPSLLTPVDVLQHSIEIVDESIAAAIGSA